MKRSGCEMRRENILIIITSPLVNSVLVQLLRLVYYITYNKRVKLDELHKTNDSPYTALSARLLLINRIKSK